jgi:hypothetical protein
MTIAAIWDFGGLLTGNVKLTECHLVEEHDRSYRLGRGRCPDALQN